jgi:hypothetical protein
VAKRFATGGLSAHWLRMANYQPRGPPKSAEPKDTSQITVIETNTQHDLDLKGDVGKQHQRRTVLITSTGRKHSFAASSQFIKWTDNLMMWSVE